MVVFHKTRGRLRKDTREISEKMRIKLELNEDNTVCFITNSLYILIQVANAYGKYGYRHGPISSVKTTGGVECSIPMIIS